MNILGQKEKKRLVWLGLILVLSVLINLVNSPNLECVCGYVWFVCVCVSKCVQYQIKYLLDLQTLKIGPITLDVLRIIFFPYI